MALQDGETFEMMSTDTTQVRMNGDAVKELLLRLIEEKKITDKEAADCFKEINFITIKTARKDSALKPKFRPPNLANMTPSGVVDMLGALREQAGLLKKEEGIYKEYLKVKVIQPELDSVDKVVITGIDDDGVPTWAKYLDGSDADE